MALLSEQQITIVKLAERGLTNKEIARQLNVGDRAIETQFRRLKDKLKTANKTETIAVATRLISERMNRELAGKATITHWMQAYVVAFDEQFRIVYTNVACQKTFDFAILDPKVGKELWKTITPGMLDKQRFKRLSSETSRDYAGHPLRYRIATALAGL